MGRNLSNSVETSETVYEPSGCPKYSKKIVICKIHLVDIEIT